MRFTNVLRNKPYKTKLLRNELLKPWWEYTRGELEGKNTFMQGEPRTVPKPRLAPHLDPGRLLSSTPRDIEHFSWVEKLHQNKEDLPNTDVRTDQEYFRNRYCIILNRRRCGNSPNNSANRDIFDIVLRDQRAFGLPHSAEHHAKKIDLELLGQYDGYPNKNNEKVLSLDVDKVLYYIGLGVSLGQDFAELLGVLGLLPVHPSTSLRLTKLHETRANLPARETPYMLNETTMIDAAYKRLQMADVHDYTQRDGPEAVLSGEVKQHHHNMEIAKAKRAMREAQFLERTNQEKKKMADTRARWLGQSE